MSARKKATGVYVDVSSNFHPFECDGRGKCIHCDRRHTYRGEGEHRHHALDTIEDAKWTVEHDPATCALCDPAYDMSPNEFWPAASVPAGGDPE